MVRQNTNPYQHRRTQRYEQGVLGTSGRAGVVVPLAQFPLLRGDSCAGSVMVDIELGHMPKPLRNAVMFNVQAWMVPKSAFPQFNGLDEFMMSYNGETITALGQADRSPPPFFTEMAPSNTAVFAASDLAVTLGLHPDVTQPMNSDLVDAYNLVHNFRLASYSSKLTRRPYFSEDPASSTALARAFWPTNRFSNVVPDYERALVVGALDLDVSAGTIPVTGIERPNSSNTGGALSAEYTATASEVDVGASGNASFIRFLLDNAGGSQIEGDMSGQTVTTTLNDIDMARRSRAFAEWRSTYAGNDPTGFASDDAILSDLMQGLTVPEESLHRPYLLGQQRVMVGFQERFATDGASLEQSTSQGGASVRLPLNVPQTNEGGHVIVIAELLPERIYERAWDNHLQITDVGQLPDAVRDMQRVEPVDLVENRRLDTAHTSPEGLYGYEAMNDQWNRSYTRLGGVFHSPTPGGSWTENRSNIWLADIVDPTFTNEHFLAPAPFPHDVFSDETAPAFEATVRHSCMITGLTQIGDVLVENNDDYEAITNPDGT